MNCELFFFQYLNTSGLNSSRHSQEEDESETRGPPSSLPPSPFIDNVSTPQPFFTTQAWPSPVWHCFIKGSLIRFDKKDDEFRRVEELSNNHSPLNKRSEEANYSVNGLIVTEIKETKDLIANSKVVKVCESLLVGNFCKNFLPASERKSACKQKVISLEGALLSLYKTKLHRSNLKSIDVFSNSRFCCL